MGIPTFFSANRKRPIEQEKLITFSKLKPIKNHWKISPKRLGSVAQQFMQSFGTQRSMLAQLS
ncbi:hypothetical protein K3169_16750 [Pseudomonas phytophila]|uniref:Transposase n=1 Tax=Pseudomonas phytophila TaxID=2867264 RepID=A0ABY6F813_9PSED|nr:MULTISPECIES: hypothetical protein [Pseudomonas]MCD5991339.1 hypothetical protein [Pseudomonas quasicaspiana]UXZ94024.1 hypothetical protein K3169_16750 [Pseudomonas phytophila]